MRCKLCALLLPTYKLSGDEEAFVRLHDTMRGLLPVVKAPQSRALLLVTLYGCTDNALYRRHGTRASGSLASRIPRLRKANYP